MEGYSGSETSEGGAEPVEGPQLPSSGGLTPEPEASKTAQLSEYGLRGGLRDVALRATIRLNYRHSTSHSIAVLSLTSPPPLLPRRQPPPRCPTSSPPWSATPSGLPLWWAAPRWGRRALVLPIGVATPCRQGHLGFCNEPAAGACPLIFTRCPLFFTPFQLETTYSPAHM